MCRWRFPVFLEALIGAKIFVVEAGIMPLLHFVLLLELLDHLGRNVTDIPVAGKHLF